jgi:hypothetical protein
LTNGMIENSMNRLNGEWELCFDILLNSRTVEVVSTGYICTSPPHRICTPSMVT